MEIEEQERIRDWLMTAIKYRAEHEEEVLGVVKKLAVFIEHIMDEMEKGCTGQMASSMICAVGTMFYRAAKDGLLEPETDITMDEIREITKAADPCQCPVCQLKASLKEAGIDIESEMRVITIEEILSEDSKN